MRFVDLLTPDCQRNADYTPIPTIHQCLEKVVSGEVDLAVIPVENSSNGSVVLALDSLRDLIHNNTTPVPSRSTTSSGEDNQQNVTSSSDLDTLDGLKTTKITVINEIFVPIQHCLLSFAPSIDRVSRVYTHPQAWGQVTKFLDAQLPASKAPRIDTNSTSAAAARVASEQEAKNEQNEQGIGAPQETDAEDSNKETFSAAVASRAAAKVHHVPILVPDISNLSSNTTRFLVFARQGFPVDRLRYKQGLQSVVPAKRSSDEVLDMENLDCTSLNNNQLSKDFVTLVSLTVNHDEPGSLCKCLQALSSNGINLTSINSRPAYNPSAAPGSSDSVTAPPKWSYVFFIEFYGNLYTDSLIRQALRTVQKNSSKLTVLGSFPRNPAYYSSSSA